MKKILILSSSPRKNGNSALLCRQFAAGAESAGHSVEILDIARVKVSPCLGCNACDRNDGICVQKDDMIEIKEKLMTADVIALASPIYFYSMTAQMKTVIDRTYAFYQELAGKEFYYIITCGGPGMEYTETMVASMRGFTCCIPDAQEKGILCAAGVNDAGDVKDTESYTKAYEMGQNC